MRDKQIEDLKDYKYGFSTDIESFKAPKGLNEDVIKFISNIKKEPQWLLDWRLKAFERLKVLKEPDWQKPKYPKIDYQDLYYYSAPKSFKDKPKSLDELDPKLLETYQKLGIPLNEQKRLNGIAVDAVFDSVSVATTFKETLTKQGINFMLSTKVESALNKQEKVQINCLNLLNNKSEIFDGLYFVGAGTHPGAGVPGVLSSAKVLDKIL